MLDVGSPPVGLGLHDKGGVERHARRALHAHGPRPPVALLPRASRSRELAESRPNPLVGRVPEEPVTRIALKLAHRGEPSGPEMTSRVLLALVAKDDRLALDGRRQAYRPLPNAKKAPHDFLGVVLPQIAALVVVLEEQLSPVLEVRVLDVNDGVSLVGELKEKLLLDGAKLARLDFVPLVAVRPRESKELVLADEIGRQKLVDERHV